jgi:hypothetical protein
MDVGQVYKEGGGAEKKEEAGIKFYVCSLSDQSTVYLFSLAGKKEGKKRYDK